MRLFQERLHPHSLLEKILLMVYVNLLAVGGASESRKKKGEGLVWDWERVGLRMGMV